MVQHCVAYGCKEASRSGASVSFHSFPADEKRKKQWLVALQREGFSPSKHSRLCSKHFTSDCFDKEAFGIGAKLKPNAIPTIFNIPPHLLQTKKKQKSPVKRKLIEESIASSSAVQLELSNISSSMSDEGRISERSLQDSNEVHFTAEEQSNTNDKSDVKDFEDIPLTLQLLKNETQNVILPSRLWVVQEDPKGRFVAFSRMPLQFEENQVIADKVVVLTETMVPAVFFKEIKLNLPSSVSNTPLQSLEQVSDFLEKIQRLAFCLSEQPNSKCCVYVDKPSSLGYYCSKCTAKHMEDDFVM